MCDVTDIPWADNDGRILTHMIPCGMERWMVVGESGVPVKQGERCWEFCDVCVGEDDDDDDIGVDKMDVVMC